MGFAQEVSAILVLFPILYFFILSSDNERPTRNAPIVENY